MFDIMKVNVSECQSSRPPNNILFNGPSIWLPIQKPNPLNMIPEGLEKVGYEGFFIRNVDQKWRFMAWV